MQTLSILSLGALPFAVAQNYGGGSSSASPTSAATASATSSSDNSIQTVSVGEDGFSFNPSNLTADVGSKVVFEFYPPTHSVAQSTFDSPCAPLSSSSFFSGVITTTGSGSNADVFTITINDTSPIWLYCGIPTHCQAGMAGVINPPSNTSQTLALYQAAASKVKDSTTPASAQGGVLGATANASTPSGTSATSSPSASSSGTSGAVNNLRSIEWFGMGLATIVAWGWGMLI